MRFGPLAVGDAACVCLTFAVGMDTARDPRVAQLAHYAEHLCATFGPRVRRELELAAVLANAWTDGELTCFFAVGHVEPVLRVWLPAMLASLVAPDLRDARVRNEARAALAEVELAAQQPRAGLRELVARVEAPYSGEADAAAQAAFLEKLARSPAEARARVARFVRAHYAPEKAHALALAHPKHRAALEAALARARGALSLEAHPEGARARFGYGAWHAVQGAGQAHVEVRLATLGTEPPEVAECAATIVRAQMMRALRERRGLVYHVRVFEANHARSRAERESGRFRAWMCVGTSCDPRRAGAVVRAILESARRASASAARIEAWRRGVRLALHATPPAIAELAAGLVRDCAEGRAVRTPAEFVRAANAMTDAPVRAAVRRVRESALGRRYVVFSHGAA